MKLLKFWLGGRPRSWDDLKNLQDQVATVESVFAGAGVGNFIFRGCAVTANGSNFNVGAGLVYIDGKLLVFDGAVNVPLPGEIYALPAVESDSRPDGNGTLHNAQILYKAGWRAFSGQPE